MRASPIFVATFADGETVRMSCWHGERKTFDLRRGYKLAHSAYITRRRNTERHSGTPSDGPPVAVPTIVEAHFIDEDGVVLHVCDLRETIPTR
jgi:hypothetical protein